MKILSGAPTLDEIASVLRRLAEEVAEHTEEGPELPPFVDEHVAIAVANILQAASHMRLAEYHRMRES